MSDVYVMEDDSRTKQLQRIKVADAREELKTLLEHNLNLLPGDQISPGQDQ